MQHSQANHKNEVKDLGSLHHYRTEIPNIVFKLKDPWIFKAYCVFKKTAGDNGSCFKSNRTLSEEIGCSIPTLIKLKKSLEAEGLIILTKRNHENGGDMPDLIEIVDIWAQNMYEMSKAKGGGKPDLGGGLTRFRGGSKRRLPKEEQKEEDLNKEQQAAPVCSLDAQTSVVPSDEQKQIDEKKETLEWFISIGCDRKSAAFFTKSYTTSEVRQASRYVMDQIQKNKKKNKKIHNIVAYMRRVLEEKWWMKKENDIEETSRIENDVKKLQQKLSTAMQSGCYV
jgi:hypothetical protein